MDINHIYQTANKQKIKFKIEKKIGKILENYSSSFLWKLTDIRGAVKKLSTQIGKKISS